MLAARAGLVSGLPLMHRTSYIRLARVEEAAALSDLCFRSKAVWGYELFIEPRHIRSGVGRALLAAARRRAAEDAGRPERSGLLRARRGGADR